MSKNLFIFFLLILLSNKFLSTQAYTLNSPSLTAGTIYDISQDISGNTNHKKAEYDFTSSETIKSVYFKYQYQSSSLPTSLITTFRIEFDTYSTDISNYKVFCTNVATSTTDEELKSILDSLKMDNSACIDGFKRESSYDGIVRLDKSKNKLGIMLVETKSGLSFTGRINLRIKERILETDELKPNDEETYTLVPFTIVLDKFRSDGASKILFYSYSRNLQMFYPNTEPYPKKLFSGNILSIYTNPNMIRQKYHDASIMTLWVYPSGFSSKKNLEEEFQFEVKLYESNYLLDYYVSYNSEGRYLNNPLLINMTECSSPYYVIYNYNKPEKTKKSLIIDQIYGKIKSISVAYEFSKNTWDEMINNDMNKVDLIQRKFILPENSSAHLDVYKIECDLPLMLNFYYIDEDELVSIMNYGDINIFTLAPYENVEVPFFNSVKVPEIIIEIYNPLYVPTVVVQAQEETVYQSNTLIKLIPMSLANGITIKERAGLSDTRIIIKVGFSNSDWEETSDSNIIYNSKFDVYAFKFPTGDDKYNYTIGFLNTSGTDDDDNVKYCINSNIGAALMPSLENCYRVSQNNPYCLKVYNPLNMYKDYSYDEKYTYYVTFQPKEDKPTSFTIKPSLLTYETNNRLFNGISGTLTISEGKANSILTALKDNYMYSFLQVQICDKVNTVKAKIKQALTGEVILEEVPIPANAKNKYLFYNNILLDSEVEITGNDNTNIFLRYSGLPSKYEPSFNDDYKITFEPSINTLIIEPPINNYEFMEYTVIIDKENEIKSKDYTLCNFFNKSFDNLGLYNKSVIADGVGSIQINFEEIGFKVGQRFDAIVYIEQKMYSKMAFLSEVIQESVGDITIDTIHEIKESYPDDKDYAYLTVEGKSSDLNYYFSFLPEKVMDVPIGALRIELEEGSSGSFTGLYCAFVNNDTDAFGRIEAVEELIHVGDSYCLGGKSKINSKRYNYIFKYDINKEDNSPKMLVIKLINGNLVNGKFNIYIRKESGTEIEKTDFSTQKMYGENENNKKSLMPYIVDLEKIRGKEDDINKISKILFYSKNSELQMYYLPENKKLPEKLFSGNIALAYTKPALAAQKYHSTVLILFSENLEEDSVEYSFRFHTKMFKSDDQIEFFVSQNEEGRTLNFPLSIEMNVCNEKHKKLYYILNYNKQEPLRKLHFDMVFGFYLYARIAREINGDTWDDLVTNSMSEIYYYQADLPEKKQHIDVIEIECRSPLLINAYYSYDNYPYQNLRKGQIVIKDISPNDDFSFTIDEQTDQVFNYSLSLYNRIEAPYITVRFSDGTEENFSGNSLQQGELNFIPSDVTIINKVKTMTRIIFKIGLNVEQGKDWEQDTSAKIDGELYVNNNKFVYKFPTNANKRDYTTIDFLVNGINENVENVKFCYSTNLGVALEASKENCYRTGKFIPYTLSFINPLIVSKDYENNANEYYISFRPYENSEFIKLKITENKYECSNRNEEGIAKQITLSEKKGSSILSLPQHLKDNILIQIRSCTMSNYSLAYKIYNAFTQEFIKGNETHFYNNTGYGIFSTLGNIYLEAEVKFEANESETNTVSAFLKHTPIDNNGIIFQNNYTHLDFDDTKNSIIIKKPIINEEFIITVIVDTKGSLGKLTQCDVAFSDKSKIGKYSRSFISVLSNTMVHFIDFAFIGFEEGTEFDLLVYAEQKYNSKLEFLYPLYQNKVGKLSGVLSVNTYIEGDKYATLDFFYNLNSNYLYFDFAKKPLGNVASLKVLSPEAKVTKVGCVFVSKYASDSTMISAVNNAMLENKNMCLNLGNKNYTEFNALINADFEGENSRLVIQVLYGFGEDENNSNKLGDVLNTINIKIAGTQFGDFTGLFDLNEILAPTPYVINLEEIRKKRINNNYVSKILFYSNTTKMFMHYINEESKTPLDLFEGNIMLVYTNPELIYQKYNNAKIMILTTDALGQTKNKINVKYFDSDAQVQYYYLSTEKKGRILNNPTAIEMTSCNLPYYYILNYNQIEKEEKELHLDTIFGEAESMKLATSLDYNSWDNLLEHMIILDQEKISLKISDYTFDILEVKCKLPLLLNLYYADPKDIKTEDLEVGDIVIFNLEGGRKKTLKFREELKGPFAYSFNVYNGYNVKPNIKITFENDPYQDLDITETGLHIKDSLDNYKNITFENLDMSSALSTRIIFKFGYVIESVFENIGNGIYQNINDENRKINLYGYKYDTTSKRLNYTGVDFTISTDEENVKFCYSTNLGTYITPSLTNCYRVGKNNPYTISTKNPLIMYKNYFQENINNYYVGFRTEELNQTIIITPKQLKYDTTERNLEGAKNKVTIKGEEEQSVYSTILTAPKNNEAYIFTHIHVCTKGEGLSYEFYNAYSGENIGYNGIIMSDTDYNYLSVPNSKLDTELKLRSNKNVEVFVKHVGISEAYNTNINNIKFNYNSKSQLLNWTQPIDDEEFKYTIFIDKINNIKNKEYTLCSIVDTTKLGRYSEILRTNSRTPNITIDFSKPDLVDCKEFDVIVLAEQINNGKLTILSPVYNSKGESSDDKKGGGEPEGDSNIGLIVVIIILSLVIVIGGIIAFFIIRKYLNKGSVIQDGKATSMAMLGGTKNEKLVESQAEVDA